MGLLSVTDDQAERITRAIEAQKVACADYMPTEHDALRVISCAIERLRELGWSEAMYCPKDGTIFDAIEAGSTGIHECSYDGEWPNGHYWIYADGDVWPSKPIMFRPKPSPTPSAAPGRPVA